ncbi:MAG: FAD-dependent oxidoreductase, partial [Cyanobacteria bacterium P01_F01_bin.42]
MNGSNSSLQQTSQLEQQLQHLQPTLKGLRSLDQRIKKWREQGTLFADSSDIVQTRSEPLDSADVDVVIAGGTLGIILGAALVRRGWQVAVVERGQLQGR